MLSKRLLVGLMVLLGGLAQGCRQNATAGATARPTNGSSLPDYTLTAKPIAKDAPGPKRIVSAAPNVTEICAALGLLPRLVGRTKYCKQPPAVAQIESFGGLTDANIETLVALRPELIIISGTSRAHADQFERLGLNYASIPDDRLEDLFTAITQIGELTQTQDRATQLNTAIRADLKAVAQRYHAARPQRVLILIGTLKTPPAPPFVASQNSFYGDLLTLLGEENAIGETKGFGQLSLETIVELDPDVIIELDPDGTQRPNGAADALQAWSQVGQLSAVRDQRIRVLTGGQHYLIGPRIAQTAEVLALAIQDASISDATTPDAAANKAPK